MHEMIYIKFFAFYMKINGCFNLFFAGMFIGSVFMFDYWQQW